MERSKRLTQEELGAVGRAILAEKKTIKRTPEDDDFDAEYKRGLNEAFTMSVKIIFSRIEQLAREIEQK